MSNLSIKLEDLAELVAQKVSLEEHFKEKECLSFKGAQISQIENERILVSFPFKPEQYKRYKALIESCLPRALEKISDTIISSLKEEIHQTVSLAMLDRNKLFQEMEKQLALLKEKGLGSIVSIPASTPQPTQQTSPSYGRKTPK